MEIALHTEIVNYTSKYGIMRRGVIWIMIMRYHPDGPWLFGGSGGWGEGGV